MEQGEGALRRVDFDGVQEANCALVEVVLQFFKPLDGIDPIVKPEQSRFSNDDILVFIKDNGRFVRKA